MTDLSNIAVHTITNRPWSLAACVEAYVGAGIGGISVWRETLEPIGLGEAAKIIQGSGLRVPALVRGGFMVHATQADRARAADDNKRCVGEAAAIGAETIVIVPGSSPDVPLHEGRSMVQDALAPMAQHAASAGVKLALEPLHPMYAGSRSCVNTLTQAREICEAIDHPALGVAVDVFHVWWDDRLEHEIGLLGEQGRLMGFHVCDFKPDMRNMLTDRGLMGEGCVPIRTIRAMMESAKYTGMIEIEVLSEHHWARDQATYLLEIVHACSEHV
jgi:sugar phosphate isomerase/epimerase